MNKIILLMTCMFLLLSSKEVAFSQEKLNEFVITPDSNCPFTIRPGDGEYGFVVIYTTMPDLTFNIPGTKGRLVEDKPDYDDEMQRYILKIKPNDANYKSYTIRIQSKGFRPGEIKDVQVKQKESQCFDVNPKNSSALEKLARITVYDKDNKLLVGAVVKNKITGKVYGSTRYDGTLAINFDNKGESANVIVSHPSYSDKKEITVQAGAHDYIVYLRNYKLLYNSSALWRSAVLPGWGQFYKERNGRGTLIVIGETLTLAAGGLSLYNELNQKSIMDKPEVSYQDYIAAEKSYEQWNTTRHISFITAAVIYSLNLVDAYLTPAKPQKNLTLAPNVMNANGELAVSATLSINF